MASVPYLRLVYSSARAVQARDPAVGANERTLRQRFVRGLDRTPITYAATATCASLALGSLDRLRDTTPIPEREAWSGLADKAVLAILPIAFSVCLATDAAALATYPWRLWRAVKRGSVF